MASQRKRAPVSPIKTVPFDISKGMHSGGNASRIPEGTARRIRNMLWRDSVWEKRPQLTYESLTVVRGLINFSDPDTDTSRLCAISTNTGLPVFNLKNSDESWTAIATGTGSIYNRAVDDSSMYGASLYLVGYNSVTSRYVVSAFNGVTVDESPLGERFTYSLAPRTLCSYIGRLFVGAPVLVVSPVDFSYDLSGWTLANCSTNSAADGSRTVQTLTPTATTGATISLNTVVDSRFTVRDVVWQFQIAAMHPTYRIPLTLKFRYIRGRLPNTAYTLADVVTPDTGPNGFRYRYTTAGTSSAGSPVYPTTIGATVADGTAVLTCESTDVLSSSEIFAPSLSDTDKFQSFTLATRIPDQPVTAPPQVQITRQVDFGHGGAAVTLASIKISSKDGLDDTNPSKENHGQQLTVGSFAYPFFNIEDSAEATIDHGDYIYWTEPFGTTAPAQNSYRLSEHPGRVTVLREIHGRLVVFKRNAYWIFESTENPDIPVLPVGRARVGIGCLHPRAIDSFENVAYFIGDNEIYRWKDGSEPEPICGDGMRDEIMSKSSASWVESQSQPSRPLLCIDQKERFVWVYTQKGKLYCFDIDNESWSVHDAGGGATTTNVGSEIVDMAFNSTTGKVYVSFLNAPAGFGTAGLSRLDASVSPAEDQISSSGTLPVHAEIWPRPIELSGPRYDIRIDQMRFHHAITADQTGQTTTAYVSFDQGITFPKSNQITVSPLSAGEYTPVTIPLWQSWGTLQLRLLHSGKGQAASFNVSTMEADVKVLRGEYPKSVPTAGSASL